VFGLIKNWVDLFRQDRLLADKAKFYRGLSLGLLAVVILFIGVALLTHLLWLAAIIGGLIGGALQPLLFRNLRYR
jgi:hypothetical protein